MRNKMLKTVITLLGLVIIAGCGKSNNDDISDKLKFKVTAVPEQGKADEKPKPSEENDSEQGEPLNEKGSEKEGAKETPVLVMHRDSKYEWGDGSVPRIKHTYGYLLSGDEYAKDHKNLAESLEKARDETIGSVEETYNPYYIPTDLSNIRMILDPKGPDGGGTCTISIDAEGKIEKRRSFS